MVDDTIGEEIAFAHDCNSGSSPADMNTSSASRKYACGIAKRVFDIVFSALVIIFTILPLSLISLVIAAETKTFPIYFQQRIGKDGKAFSMLKLRTMVADADDVDKYFSSEQMRGWQKERKVEDDPRVTKFGLLLRKMSLDEVPQFINVLRGDMSVIGPRPITDAEMSWFEGSQDVLLSVKPGITGYWQTQSRNCATFESGERQRLELYYVHNASPQLDARIFLDTFGAIMKKTGR